MTTEIMKKENNYMTTGDVLSEKFDSSDVIVPAIYLMQSNSEFVADELAQPGEFVKSTDKSVLGAKDKPFDFIPLTFNKSFRIVKQEGNEWVRNEAWNPSLSHQREFEENGEQLKRIKCLNVFGLLPSEVEAEQKELKKVQEAGEMFDLEKALKPILLTFRSMSYKAGKIITDHFVFADRYKAKPYTIKFSVGCRKEKNDKGNYFVMDVKSSGKVDPSMHESCEYWRNMILKGTAKVDESLESIKETETREF